MLRNADIKLSLGMFHEGKRVGQKYVLVAQVEGGAPKAPYTVCQGTAEFSHLHGTSKAICVENLGSCGAASLDRVAEVAQWL